MFVIKYTEKISKSWQQQLQRQHFKRKAPELFSKAILQHLALRVTVFLASYFILITTLAATVTATAMTAQGAAVYTNDNFHASPTFEPICNVPSEHFIECEGKESSLILEFNSPILTTTTTTTAAAAATHHMKLCTRILSAPTNYGFIIRLILPKLRHHQHQQQQQQQQQQEHKQQQQQQNTINNENKDDGEQLFESRKLNEMKGRMENRLNMTTTTKVTKKKNLTIKLTQQQEQLEQRQQARSCPLSVFSSHDPHAPQWRVDPCQLEDMAPEMEDPVRLFHGRVRIVWEHANHTLNSKLMVTVLGRGEQCRSSTKHQCLKIGDEPLLCISKDLICDGIRHCPYSNEYDSDEDYNMCWKRSRYGEQPLPAAMETDIFEHFAWEVFRNLFAFDVSTTTTTTTTTTTIQDISKNSSLTTYLHQIPFNEKNLNNSSGADTGLTLEDKQFESNTTESESMSFLGRSRNSTRNGFNSDLSKYGPWGYLMLGMLLCGGALLICGLWASASQHDRHNTDREASMNSATHSNNFNGQNHGVNNTRPPNYEELDPPPAYSVLFPNQKASSTSTLNSIEIQSTNQGILSPSAPSSTRAIHLLSSTTVNNNNNNNIITASSVNLTPISVNN